MSKEEKIISLYKDYEKLKNHLESLDKSESSYKELERQLQIIDKLFLSYQDIIRDYKINKIL